LELAKEYGAAVVVGTIDEEGMRGRRKGIENIAPAIRSIELF
jgi:cobalamin-dependent methionine synthase I